jgi:response regulator RpfG family c-di-GMP phosphodiesterase
MLKNSTKEIIRTASIIAYHHHEKYNGKGYPNGLKGEEIHIYGRITAIADVFDALGTMRVYKPAWEMDEILEYFKSQRGEHFDPYLLDIFFENIDEFLAIRDSFKDQFL